MTEFKADAALPKSGHVNEVCKEWLVREDGALAYKLQSEEITDFYKGNRYRNAVVRHDFPTALEEQIKEKETAAKHAEKYRRYLTQQEEHDKRMAKDIADKLERDLEEQRQRELEESENIAKAMQEMYVNLPPPQRRLQRHQQGLEYTEPQTSISKIKTSSIRDMPSSSSAFVSIKNHNPTNGHDRIASVPTPVTPSYENVQKRHVNHMVSSSIDLDSIEPFESSECSSLASRSSRHHKSNSFDKSPEYENVQLQKLSPEKFDILMGNPNCVRKNKPGDIAEATNGDPNEIVNFEEFGLPLDEIKEISYKMAQEKKDEALARQLQEMEKHDGISQEEKDRILAIEAQDKELAKMLQEREKAKAKRAKEKARLKKSQQQLQKSLVENQSLHDESIVNDEIREEHPHDIDLEPYSNPVDLIPHLQYRQQQEERNLNMSIHSSYSKDEDIYTLPVDSRNGNNPRPSSLHIPSECVPQPRSEHYTSPRENKIAQSPNEISPRIPHALSNSYEQSSSPTPPYMPIQGTRRSNSTDDRKKKSKDKCTHQ